jgi:ribA/ribD-fused uncharacterized protein
MLDLTKYSMRITDEFVSFWGGPCSNWFKCPIEGQLPVVVRSEGGRRALRKHPDVLRFAHNEQFMMAGKSTIFGDFNTLARIMKEPDQQKVKDLGKEVGGFDQEVWDSSNVVLVAIAGYYKFTQYDELYEFMLDVQGRRFVEGSPKDRIWGVKMRWDDPKIEDPANWRGENRLGQALDITSRMIADYGREADPYQIVGASLWAVREERDQASPAPRML